MRVRGVKANNKEIKNSEIGSKFKVRLGTKELKYRIKSFSPNKRDMQRLEKEKCISAFLSCCLDSCKPSPLTEVKSSRSSHNH